MKPCAVQRSPQAEEAPGGKACALRQGPHTLTVDSKKLEYGPGSIYAGVPAFQAFGNGGQAYSNFRASTVGLTQSNGSTARITLGCTRLLSFLAQVHDGPGETLSNLSPFAVKWRQLQQAC